MSGGTGGYNVADNVDRGKNVDRSAGDQKEDDDGDKKKEMSVSRDPRRKIFGPRHGTK